MYGVRETGKRKKEKKTDFEDLDRFWDSLNRVGKIYNARHAWTLKKLVRRVKLVHWGDNDGRMLHR